MIGPYHAFVTVSQQSVENWPSAIKCVIAYSLSHDSANGLLVVLQFS